MICVACEFRDCSCSDFCSAGMLLASILRICSMTLLSWRSNCLIWRV